MKIIEVDGEFIVTHDPDDAPEVDAGPLAFGVDEEYDEPWEEYDPEAEAPELIDPLLSYGAVDLEDTSTYERWLQSALKALVAPELVVDGKVGPRTTAAVKRFQAAAQRLRGRGPALAVDGIAGKKTIAALEETTESSAPPVKEGDRPATPSPSPSPTPSPTSSADASVTVTEAEGKYGVEYVIRSADDEVRFSYWSKQHKQYRPYAVDRYKGARKGLLTDDAILAAGYSQSELEILRANALKESGGAFGAINTWDNQIVSWGMAQFAGHAGTLAALLADLRDDERSAAAYRRFFVSAGIDVAEGEYPYGNQTRRGWHVVVQDGDAVHRGDRGWEHIRSDPRLIGAFLLAGNDVSIQLGQVLFWRRAFLVRAYRKLLGRALPGRSGARVSSLLTATRSIAVVVRLYNWMPAYVVKWGDRFLKEIAGEAGDEVYDPRTWDQAREDRMVQWISDQRKAAKRGDYDDYALDLSRRRGSFGAGSAAS